MMSRLLVAPIVEGHGEVRALRILLQRLGSEILDAHIEMIAPIRGKRTQFVQRNDLGRWIELAVDQLRQRGSESPTLVLVLLDADEDLPCRLGPSILDMTRNRDDADVSCVVANVEYETWLVAGADTLGDYLDLSRDIEIPRDPEARRLGKGWIQRRLREKRGYSPTTDQPRMTSRMDLHRARERSPSFDKLCRELGKRLLRVEPFGNSE